MSVDSQRAMKELDHLQSTLDALSAGNPDDDSASSRSDEEEEEASAPSSEESAEEDGDGEDAGSISSGGPRGGREAGDLAAAFGATEFFGDKENRGGTGATRSEKKSGRKSSLESLLASPDDASALLREEDAGRSGSSGAGKKRSESVLGMGSDASRSSLEGRRLSSLASGSQASASSAGAKPRSKTSSGSLLGMFGEGNDAAGDQPTSATRRPSARSRAKGPS
jgi:hypothetical protein